MACASNRMCIHQNLKRLIKVLRGQPGSRQSDLPLGSVQACAPCQGRCTWPLCQCPDSGVFEWTSAGVDQSNSWGCHTRSSGWPVSKKPGWCQISAIELHGCVFMVMHFPFQRGGWIRVGSPSAHLTRLKANY